MKIAFDAKRLFNNHTGLGNYSRTLVDNLALNYPSDEHILLAPNTDKSEYLGDYKNFQIHDPKPRISALWRSFNITKDINHLNPDVYHGLSNELPFSAYKIKAKKFVTIHDLFFEKFPQDFTALDRVIYRKKTTIACKFADHIVAISEATKEDIVSILGIDSTKISVIYQSCAAEFQNNTPSHPVDLPQLPNQFALYVGTINKRKNLEGILKAMSVLPHSNRIPLVIVGEGKVNYVSELKKIIADNQLESQTFFLGRLSNQILAQLYRKARFLCLPSFYEGFGIPIIESLFSGTPVITSNVSSLPEAAGKCGILIDPNSVEELSSSLQILTESDDLLKKMQENIPTHLEKFTAANTAKNLQCLYKSIV